jgi:hypothetical protein
MPENALGICRRAAKKTRVWKKPQVKNLKPSTDQQQAAAKQEDKLKTRNFGDFVGRSEPKFFYQEQQEYLKACRERRSCTKQGAKPTTD